MKQNVRKLLAVVIIIGSLGTMFYPFISNYFFEHRADDIIETYQEETKNMTDMEKKQLWQAAEEYNTVLQSSGVQLTDPFNEELLHENTKDVKKYMELLNVNDNGIMCYVEVPKIRINLPVYHGTTASVLENGIGHLEGSSLPIGGAGTHCVISGHTGLNNAKLFTDLTELKKGDQFYIHTLGEILAYEVDQIEVIEPNELDSLIIVDGMDCVTMVTCTPYGVNSHRLLVRGIRIPYDSTEKEQQTPDLFTGSQWMREYLHALYIGLAIAAVLFIISHLTKRRQEQRRKTRRIK